MTARILIVDDEPDMEPLFRQKLRHEVKAGRYALDFAFSAKDALAQLEDDVPPSVVVVLSDINMPGMNGFELVSLLRPRRPDLAISMVTAYDDEDTQAKAIASGADWVFAKPIDFAALKTYLDGVIA